MHRNCPSCGSPDVRRSSFHDETERAWLGVFSPYRCRQCRAGFRVVSSRIQSGAKVLAVSVVGIGIVLLFYYSLFGAASLLAEVSR